MSQNPPLAYTLRISPGIEGIRETLYYMRQMVKQARRDPTVIAVARTVTRAVLPKDWQGEIDAIFYYVRDSFRYVEDPRDDETLVDPLETMKMGSGDCDDLSVLLAALLESIGHPTAFKAVGFQAGDLSHVYVLTRDGDAWIPLDPTEPVAPGWEPDGIRSKFVVHV